MRCRRGWPTTSPFPICCCWSRAGIASCWSSRASARYRRLGTTIDDAAGEAFDKTAKLLGLRLSRRPGGGARGARRRCRAGSTCRGRCWAATGCDFSFSGLKTAAAPPGADGDGPPTRRPGRAPTSPPAFQAAVADSLLDRTRRAIAPARARHPERDALGGGRRRRGQPARARGAARRCAAKRGFRFVAPPLGLCTDNAAMIAWAGVERLRAGLTRRLRRRPAPALAAGPPRRRRPSARRAQGRKA